MNDDNNSMIISTPVCFFVFSLKNIPYFFNNILSLPYTDKIIIPFSLFYGKLVYEFYNLNCYEPIIFVVGNAIRWIIRICMKRDKSSVARSFHCF